MTLVSALENTKGYGKPVNEIVDHTNDRNLLILRVMLSISGYLLSGVNCSLLPGTVTCWYPPPCILIPWLSRKSTFPQQIKGEIR